MEDLNQDIYQLAESVLATAGELITHDLNRGSAGNVSVRHADGFIITPTGIENKDCTSEDMVKVLLGDPKVVQSKHRAAAGGTVAVLSP